MIPLIAESEKGRGQTESPFEKKAEMWWAIDSKLEIWNLLERSAIESDSLVNKSNMDTLKRVAFPRLEVWIQQN